MSVNKVIYDGQTLIDISDSTINSSNMLEGVVGYGANGKKVIGAVTLSSMYPTSSKFNVSLPASKWILNSGAYVQDVAADVAVSDCIIVQILSTDDYASVIADYMSKVECGDGYVRVTFSELPDIDLCLEIALINGLTESSKEALSCLNCEQLVLSFSRSGWSINDDGLYSQSIPIDVLASDVIYGEILLSDDRHLAEKEIEESYAVSKIEVSNGLITAICYENKPDVTLKYFLKRFKAESVRNYYNKALHTGDTKSPHYYVDGYPYTSTQFDSSYNATALFEIEPYTTYTIGLVPAFGVVTVPWYEASYGIFFYDENEDFISGTKDGTFITPINAKYARFNYAIAAGITLDRLNERCVLVKGDTLPNEYIDYA